MSGAIVIAASGALAIYLLIHKLKKSLKCKNQGGCSGCAFCNDWRERG